VRECAGVGLCLVGVFLSVALATHSVCDPPVKWGWDPSNKVRNACGVVGAYVSAAMFESLGYSGGWVVCITIFGLGIGLATGRKRLLVGLLGGGGAVFGAAMAEALLLGGAPPYGGAAGRFYSSILQTHLGTVGTALVVGFLFFGCAATVVGPPIRRLVALLKKAHTKLRPVLEEPFHTASARTQEKEKVERKKSSHKKGRKSTTLPNRAKETVSQQKRSGNAQDPFSLLPPLDILATPPRKKVCLKDASAIKETATQLQQAFATYDVETSVTGYNISPSFVTYRVRVPDKTRLKFVKSLADDLALKLGMPGLTIEGPVDEPNTVLVSMQRERREIVWMREVLNDQTRTHFGTAYQLPLFLGKTQDNRPLIVDLYTQPHLLIGGATRSGKTVCVSSIITSVLMTRTPQQARLILIDPKRVEFTKFGGIPHLLCEVIDDASAAMAALQWAVSEMEHRYRLLRMAGVNEITQLAKLDKERQRNLLEALGGDETAENGLSVGLPYIVIVVDEFADLMGQTPNPKQLQALVMRLAQKARAAGIHLVLATQRPSTDVVQGLVKANFPSRIAFRVASSVDSRIILGTKGAEKLLGRGDMFFVASDGADVTRAQAVFLSDTEIERLVAFLQQQPAPEYDPDLVGLIKQAVMQQEQAFGGILSATVSATGAKTNTTSGSPDGYDPLFFEAVDVVMREGRASCGVLQSNMGIGYPRANKILKQMEEHNIIGPVKMGAKSRDILITQSEWEQMKEKIKAEIGSGAA